MALGKKIRIALDAMGGDYAPEEVVKGALQASKESNVEIILVGSPSLLEAEMIKHPNFQPLKIYPAEEVIREGEPPAQTLRVKRDASVLVATKLIKKGEADAIISAGPTGAVVGSALMILGLAPGVDRPIVGGPFLGFSPKTVVMDVGGNVDCKPYHLLDFAIVGKVYAQKLLGVSNPTVALLSIGAEEGKGNELVKESYPVFKESGLNFIGNVEGNDLVTGRANVIVCDGFVGNILVKFAEALGEATAHWLKEKLSSQLPVSQLEELNNELINLTNAADAFGGGPLWGVNGIAIVMHGRSKAQQFCNAINQAKMIVESDMINIINSELERMKGEREDGRNKNDRRES